MKIIWFRGIRFFGWGFSMTLLLQPLGAGNITVHSTFLQVILPQAKSSVFDINMHAYHYYILTVQLCCTSVYSISLIGADKPWSYHVLWYEL